MLMNMLNSIFTRKKTNHLGFEEIQIVQMVAQQTVMSLDGIDHVSEDDKSRLACIISEDLLKDMGIDAPAFLIEIVIGASLRLIQELPAPKDYVWRTHISPNNIGTGNANFAA